MVNQVLLKLYKTSVGGPLASDDYLKLAMSYICKIMDMIKEQTHNNLDKNGLGG